MQLIVIYIFLSRVGRNVAAGMTGGLAYLLDEDNTLQPKVGICFLSFCLRYILGEFEEPHFV
jgi:glutamate synthase domain-containing protein 3